MNVSTNLELIGNAIQNENFPFHIVDHPMKPFGMRYWDLYKAFTKIPDPYTGIDDFIKRSPQACSWLRDQEYMVDFKYHENLELKNGSLINYLEILSKVR